MILVVINQQDTPPNFQILRTPEITITQTHLQTGYRVKPLVEGSIIVNCKPYQLRKLRGFDESESTREELESHLQEAETVN